MQHGASGPSIFTLDVLAEFASHEYKLLRQIQLVRSMNGASYYVSDDILDCWGEGESFDAARQDYEANLLEAYVDLADSNEPLSRLAAERLDAIRRFVAPA